MSEGSLAGRAGATVRAPVLVAWLCGLVLALEGYDFASVAFAAPSLIDAWHVKPVVFTGVFTAGNIGLLFGAVIAGPIGDRIGRKPVLIACVAVFGLFSLLSAFAGGPQSLLWLRFATGLGLGGGVPLAIALATDHAPAERQGRLVILMSSGVSIGNTIGGLAASQIVRFLGWPWIFALGGILPLIVMLALIAWLPESDAFHAPHEGNRVAALFRSGLGPSTLALWAMNLLNLLNNYLILLWLPVVLHASGIPPVWAIFATTVYALGTIIGAFATAPVVDRMGMEAVLTWLLALGAAALFAIGALNPPYVALTVIIGLAGIGVGGCQHGINALSGRVYPGPIRSTGAGWATGAGRIGTILGPLLGGAMIARGWSGRDILSAAAIPALGVTIAMIGLGAAQRRLRRG
ncbi:MAG: MFS transporter [Rhodospirillales bacterium]|nr:MFS transporter [Rhodospirillales bacterium]